MENPNDRKFLPGNDPKEESGNRSSSRTNTNANQTNKDEDPSTWPSGDTSLEELVKEDENRKDTRIEGDNLNAGKGTTIGNP